jgi:hypothetical protein
MKDFGTMKDFDLLLKGMHERGIKLIMDLVLIIAVTNMNGSSKQVPETIHIETTTIGGLPKRKTAL